MTKTCTKCKEVKELVQFHRHAKAKDGFNEWCKPCVRIRDRASYSKRIGREVGHHKMFLGFDVEPAERDWIRLGAFIDGEGCITITRANPTGPRRSPKWTVAILIANTNHLLPEWCKKTFGGRIYIHPRANKEKHKVALCWHVSGRHGVAVLKGVLPHLMLKRAQAENAMEMQKLLSTGTNYRLLTEEEIAKRDYYYFKGKELNRRGPDAPNVDTIQ